MRSLLTMVHDHLEPNFDTRKEVNELNIVFWFLVILVLVLVWFGCICIFPSLGKGLLNLFKQGKDVFSGEDDDDENDYSEIDNEEDYK